jgi:hypothetical protein
MPAPPPTAANKRSSLPIILAGVIALLVLGGGGVFALTYFNKGKSPLADPSAGASKAASNGPSKKYTNAILPENICPTVEIGHLATTYEKEAGAPTHSRVISGGTGQAFCTITRQHGIAATMSLIFDAIVYTDINIAISQQKQAHDDAADNHYTITPLSGVGDEAIITPGNVNAATKDTNASYWAQVRDGNLRWFVQLNVGLIGSGATLTDADRQQMIDDLGATVKATHKKLIP